MPHLTDARLVKMLLSICVTKLNSSQMAKLGYLQPSCEHLKLKCDFCNLYFSEHHNPAVNILLVWRFCCCDISCGEHLKHLLASEHLNQVKIMFICQSPCRQEHLEMEQAVGDSREIIYACAIPISLPLPVTECDWCHTRCHISRIQVKKIILAGCRF